MASIEVREGRVHCHACGVVWPSLSACPFCPPTNTRIIAVAGGFDPIHVGHVRHMVAAKLLGGSHFPSLLVVLLQPDANMVAKKGYCFMPFAERAEILLALRPVDAVGTVLDTDGTCARTLSLLRPAIFAKGGDRTPDNMPASEIAVYKQTGMQIVYGVGGDKIQSSSRLVTGPGPSPHRGRGADPDWSPAGRY